MKPQYCAALSHSLQVSDTESLTYNILVKRMQGML